MLKWITGITDGVATPESLEVISKDAQSYWCAAGTEAEQRDMSHWLGEGRWADEARWRNIGEDHLALSKIASDLAGRTSPIRTMMEWGPGGGANAVCFAQTVPHFIAVDISPPNLKECARQLESRGYHGFRGVLIDAVHPEEALEKVGVGLDFFLATAVFQHFPSKDYGVQVTRIANQLLEDDGIALIQTRYDDGTEKIRPKNRNYHSNVTYFTSYLIDEYWRIARDSGFHPLAVILKPETRYAYYLLKKALCAGSAAAPAMA
jgi:hypothetical protein